MMQHLPLYKLPITVKTLREKAQELVPLYRLQQPGQEKQSQVEAREYSSPVCYAHIKGLREGFEGLD